jgi:hypothetical protein
MFISHNGFEENAMKAHQFTLLNDKRKSSGM